MPRLLGSGSLPCSSCLTGFLSSFVFCWCLEELAPKPTKWLNYHLKCKMGAARVSTKSHFKTKNTKKTCCICNVFVDVQLVSGRQGHLTERQTSARGRRPLNVIAGRLFRPFENFICKMYKKGTPETTTNNKYPTQQRSHPHKNYCNSVISYPNHPRPHQCKFESCWCETMNLL